MYIRTNRRDDTASTWHVRSQRWEWKSLKRMPAHTGWRRCIGCLKLQGSFCKRATRSQSTSSTHNQFLFIITSYPRRRMHYLTLVPWFVGALSIGFLKTDDEPKGYHELGSTHCNTHCNTHLTLTAWFVGALRIGCLKTDDECPEDVEPKGYHELGSTHCNTHCNTHTLMMSVPRMRGWIVCALLLQESETVWVWVWGGFEYGCRCRCEWDEGGGAGCGVWSVDEAEGTSYPSSPPPSLHTPLLLPYKTQPSVRSVSLALSVSLPVCRS